MESRYKYYTISWIITLKCIQMFIHMEILLYMYICTYTSCVY